MLIDTDVLIWVLRGSPKAAAALEGDPARMISVISYMELLQGGRSRKEIRSIRDFLEDYSIPILPLSENIGHRASILMEDHGPSSGLTVADALIAASAAEHRLVLLTGNYRHFQVVQEVEARAFRP